MSHPVVTIEMENGGIIKLALDASAAPNTVKNFLSLAGKVLDFKKFILFLIVTDRLRIQ